jgi:phosphohistidine phosphatase
MKKLYLLRHADAAPAGPGQKDPGRPLTERGRRQAAEAAAEAKLKEFSFDRILTSPYERARETARIVAGIYEMPGHVTVEPLLACGCSIQEVRKILLQYQACNGILCVGHEPDLGKIAAVLLGLDHPRPFKKAECLGIDLAKR